MAAPEWLDELGPGRHVRWPVMGVHADDGDWPVATDPERLALRRRLAAEHPDCIVALPGREALVAETVERVIGYKPGTGGTGGVSYLAKALELKFFPELWQVRTSM